MNYQVWRRTANSHRLWILFFLALQLFFGMKGGTNADSRLALLSSLVEDGSFQINSYREWTVDWAETPDGSFYSNKAPGPVLVALPVFWLLDKVLTLGISDRLERDAKRRRDSTFTLPLLSLLFQALPWAILCLLFLEKLAIWKVPLEGRSLFLFAFLFGNTASLFMNSFFGHGFSAVCAVAGLYCLIERKFFYLGLAWGLLLLSDYGMAFSFPFLVGSVLVAGPVNEMQKRSVQVLAGGGIWLLLWAFYHQTCFGGVFTLPQAYQNPIFVDLKSTPGAVWGVITFLPKMNIVGELLFGQTRGILWTQPWILLVLGSMPFFWKKLRAFSGLYFSLGSFLGLLWMNSSFGAWHGGGTPGPRYLASSLPLLAPWLAVLALFTSARWKKLAWALVALSCIWCLVIFSSLSVATSGTDHLWPHYLGLLFVRPTNLVRAAILAVTAIWLLRRTWRELR